MTREQNRCDRVVRRVRTRAVARKVDKVTRREQNPDALLADLIEYAENCRSVSTMIVLQEAIAHIYTLRDTIIEIKAENARLESIIRTTY
jgi:hypothetical protein